MSVGGDGRSTPPHQIGTGSAPGLDGSGGGAGPLPSTPPRQMIPAEYGESEGAPTPLRAELRASCSAAGGPRAQPRSPPSRRSTGCDQAGPPCIKAQRAQLAARRLNGGGPW